MEESVALDSTKQKQFVKSVRGIKKLLKKNSKKVKELGPTKELGQKEKKEKPKPTPKPVSKSEEKNEVKKDVKKSNIKKSEKRKRGLVYLSHIPHGFYEHQMTEYFKQFGVVTNARVIRSKHTGNSKGYAFVEFKEPAVAEIVADTMNNYLMGKRLIKAVYIPPEKQRLHAMRKKWSFKNNPGSEQRLKIRKALNAEKNDKQELLIAKNLLSNLSNTKEKLRKLGIDYDFFVPVDVPEALNELVQKSMVDVNITTNTVELKKKIKVEEKENKSDVTKSKSTDVKNNVIVLKKENNKNKNDIKSNQKQQLKENINKNQNLVQGKDKIKKLHKQEKSTEVSKKVPENFIKINKSDSDSVDFDSDAFEEIINNDDDDLSSDDQSDVDDLSSDDTHGFNEVVQKSNSVKEKIKPTVAIKEKAKSKIVVNSKQGKGVVKNVPEKRKNTSSAPVTPKKVKFEKQNKKTLNKIVKTRK
ncbi:unnamed protein product [Euphydryas editha]|uniref:RRM domain-containing protein n=1 Tax=Euphydryas editha TaxID=104508 RepID=A0AAU9V3W6_EUPED|nr:unnamed protein product [Euphydryas editha]